MEKLNELVEMAKEISSKRWFLNADEEVTAFDNDAVADDSEEAFIGCAANIQLAKYVAAASPETILAIAEAFRALEQRAEAAEAKVKELEQEQAEHDGQIADLQGKFDLALAGLRSKTSRCDKAESKLAEMQKQKPIGRVDRGHVSDSNEYPDARVVCLHEHVGWEAFQDGTELFSRPAPAINLAELVPPKMVATADMVLNDIIEASIDGWNDCRAAILRNIEERTNGENTTTEKVDSLE